MKAIPYLFIALAVAILAGAVGMLFGTYFELVHPTVVRNGADEVATANSFWFVGTILALLASAILLGIFQFLGERSNTAKGQPIPPAIQSESLEPGVLVARPDRHLARLLQPIMMLMAVYQIPFVVLFGVYRDQWNRHAFASFSSAAILLSAAFLWIRAYKYHMAVGDLHLELDDAPESSLNQLTGRIVLNRQSDSRSKPLVLVLKLYENRDGTRGRNPNTLLDTGETINSRELYWQLRFKTKSPIENPFQSETQFPFEAAIPAWLPRPWSRPGVNRTIGLEWQLEVSGRFAGANVVATLPIDEIPQRLKQPHERRIKISQQELANFLAEQSILWRRTVETRTMTILPDRLPFLHSLVISSVCVVLALGCVVALQSRWTEFVVLLLLGSLAMLFATLWKRYVYRVTLIHDGGVDHDWNFFGFATRRSFKRDELMAVAVEPKRIRRDDEIPHAEFDIFVQAHSPKDGLIHLARIRTRLLAKAFAKAIANELGLAVVYQVSED